MAIVKISDLPLVDSPVEGTDLFVVVQDNVTKKAYASDIQTYVGFEEFQTATAGQTVFNLTTMTYAAGANNLQVFVDGVNQYVGTSYVETDNNTVTFTQGLHQGALVKFSTVQTLSTVDTSAANILFTQSGVGAVTRSVQSKERDIVSVKDFGAVGDGVADDTAAIQAAINAAPSTGGSVYFPIGTYRITSAITWAAKNSLRLFGDHAGRDAVNKATQILCDAVGIVMLDGRNSTHSQIQGLLLNGNNKAEYGIRLGIGSTHDQFVLVKDVVIQQCSNGAGIGVSLSYNANGSGSVTDSAFYNLTVNACKIGVDNYGQTNAFFDCNITSNTTAGLLIRSFSNTNWYGGIFAGNNVDLLTEVGAVAQVQNFNNVWFEQCGTAIVSSLGGSCTCSFTFMGCPALNTSVGATALMDFTAIAGNVTIVGSTNYPNGPSSSTIITNANGTYVCMNYFEGSNTPFTFTGTGKVFNLRASKWTVNNLTVRGTVDGNFYIDRAAGNNALAYWSTAGVNDYYAGVRYDMAGDWALFYSDGTIAKRYSSSAKTTESYGTAAPTTGTWARGSIVWNVEPSAGGPPGWMCVASGTPGTWKAMANLAA